MPGPVVIRHPQPGLLFTRYRYLLHILFWVGIFVYDVVIWGLVDNDYYNRFISTAAELPVKIAATYFTIYVLIDRFLIRKRYTLFMILLLASMVVFGFMLRLIAYYYLYPKLYPEGLAISLWFPPKILIGIFYIYAWVAIVSSFHLIRHYYQHQQEAQKLQRAAEQLEKEKLSAELKLLKSQINPHFLFNTLNNLYVLTLNHSANAPHMVHKLSELMSYMLFDSNQAQVALEKEVHYLRNYIDLEKLRYGERLEVKFNIDGKTDRIMVAPLLMLPLVENSFKHGARNQLAGGWIHIDLELEGKSLVLKVENSKPNVAESNVSSGIGLQNLVKRLEYLYPDQYTLQLFDEADTYMAVLRLRLNKTAEEVTVDEKELTNP
jgi:two-component system, LytTR family, sensor kinase